MVELRMREEEYHLALKAVEMDLEVLSFSHFVRIAVIKELNRQFPNEMQMINFKQGLKTK